MVSLDCRPCIFVRGDINIWLYEQGKETIKMSDKARAVHDSAIIIDALQISNWGEAVFRNMRRGGLTAVNCTVSVLENFRQTIANIIEWERAFNQYSDLIMPVRSIADIHAAQKAGKTGIIFGFQNTTAIEDNIDLITIFHALGVRVIQLTYMEANLVGQGCLERIDAGLTQFGLEVIDEMNRLGILIDLSHAGYRTTMDAIEASGKPVAFTHANPKSLCNHARNKPDDAIKALAKKGGVIGATTFPPFLPAGNDSTIKEFIDVIDYLIEMVGMDHVAVGTDFTEGHPKEFFDWLLAGKSKRGPAMKLDFPIRNPKGIQNSADFPNITDELLTRGYTESDARKILGENLVRLFNEVWNE
jgi:membrane dipeptidase